MTALRTDLFHVPTDGPRALATLLAAMIQPTNAGSINVIEVINMVTVPTLPSELPPVFAVCVVIGGRPGTVYSSKWRLLDPTDTLAGESRSPDVPFTTEIKRANVIVNLRELSAEKILKVEGSYRLQFLLNDDVVGESELEIKRIQSGNVP